MTIMVRRAYALVYKWRLKAHTLSMANDMESRAMAKVYHQAQAELDLALSGGTTPKSLPSTKEYQSDWISDDTDQTEAGVHF